MLEKGFDLDSLSKIDMRFMMLVEMCGGPGRCMVVLATTTTTNCWRVYFSWL